MSERHERPQPRIVEFEYLDRPGLPSGHSRRSDRQAREGEAGDGRTFTQQPQVRSRAGVPAWASTG